LSSGSWNIIIKRNDKRKGWRKQELRKGSERQKIKIGEREKLTNKRR
jgi:hypothetical protein